MNNVKSAYLAILLLVFPAFAVYGQKEENVWVFGSHAGIDFNQNPPRPVYTNMLASESAASVCDASGQVLFYTDGFYVWDRNHDRMPNGNGLTPFTYYGESSTQSTSQGAVIVPYPGSATKFIIFSLTQVEINADKGKLYYSVVDMNLNLGKGDVIAAQRARFLDSALLEKMTAVTGNQCNIWLLVGGQNGKLKAFNITESGVESTPVVSTAALGSPSLMVGTMCVSPDRSTLAAAIHGLQGNRYNGLVIYRFDANTGTVSNPVPLLTDRAAYGTCFSPDSRKLYSSSAGKIIQFDLSLYTTTAISASQKDVGVSGPVTALKLAPDNKIYFFSKYNGQSSVLGAVQYPDGEASLCGYLEEAITLKAGTAMSIGLPNVVPVRHNNTVSTTTTVTFPCFKDTLTLKPKQNATAYAWQDGNTDSIRTIINGGTYVVHYQKACKFYIDSFIVQGPGTKLPLIMVSGACKETANGKAWIQRISPDTLSTVRWYKAGTLLSTADTLSGVLSGNFTLRIHLPSGCDTQLKVFIPGIDETAGILADSIVCSGDTVHFKSALSPGPAPVWLVDNNVQSGNATFDYVFHQAGSYKVMLAGSGGLCSDTAIMYVTVDEPYRNLRLDPGSSGVCTGTPVNFTVTGASAESVLSYSWDYGDQTTRQTIEAASTHLYDQPGTWTITVIVNPRACPVVTLTDSVQVSVSPGIDLGSDTSMCPGASPVILANRAVNAIATRNRWYTGDTSTTFAATKPGIYALAVTTDGSNCVAYDTVKITNSCRFDMPNVFTPNGDGLNDYFFPKTMVSANLARFEMKIFNRWGQKIFETRNPGGPGWDGYFNGVLQPVGVYIYDIEALFENGQSERYSGDITLLR